MGYAAGNRRRSGSGGTRSDVRILLVGEDGVGKTSLILTLISEEFPEHTPARCDEVTIPADITPERVATHIVDFSQREQSEAALSDELQKADVVCVVYDVNQALTISKVSDYWMPTIAEVLGDGHSTPVILVGNKSDGEGDSQAMEEILPIMNSYPEIETCVECSAKSLKNISELFYYAQKAVLHPTGPLYVPEEKELTRAAKTALVRIFKLCDADNDGLLSDAELNAFQVKCFSVPLTPDAVNDVKGVVRKSISDGVLDNALTLKGFLFLHTLFIQRGRHETTWNVLRKFGYDNSLQLSRDYLYPALRVPKGCSTELNAEGLAFLTALFEKHDEDKDGCLSPTELQALFSVCPLNAPWGPEVMNSVPTNEQGWITYQGFLSYWAQQTLLDLPRTLEYLAYLGFNVTYPSQLSAVTVTRDKRIDWQKKETAREVFMCHVIGPKDAGKSAFLQGFLGRSLKEQASLNRRRLSAYTVNAARVHGSDKTLILHEIDVLRPEDPLSAYELSCDVVAFIYDVSNPASFEYVAGQYKRYFHRTRVPCLLVASKAERAEVVQSYELQPKEFAAKYKLPPPLLFRAADVGDPSNDVYSKIATLAAHPHLKHVYYVHDSSLWIKGSLGVAAVALLGFVLFKNAT